MGSRTNIRTSVTATTMENVSIRVSAELTALSSANSKGVLRLLESAISSPDENSFNNAIDNMGKTSTMQVISQTVGPVDRVTFLNGEHILGGGRIVGDKLIRDENVSDVAFSMKGILIQTSL